MAKGRGSSSSNSGSRRDHLTPKSIANRRLTIFQPMALLPPLVSPSLSRLSEVEDRRLFHVEGPNRPPLQVDGRPTSVRVLDRPKSAKKVRRGAFRFGKTFQSQTKAVLAFAEPQKVIVCLRRKRRREVLFAKKKYGAGNRSPRRTWLSQFSCRR